MLASPFAFFRGAALIMASDLAGPERTLLFDINDFDETLPGPSEWDVKRLVASLAVAARANGFGPSEREQVASTTIDHALEDTCPRACPHRRSNRHRGIPGQKRRGGRSVHPIRRSMCRAERPRLRSTARGEPSRLAPNVDSLHANSPRKACNKSSRPGARHDGTVVRKHYGCRG
jgi:hypothetical protein